MTLTKLNTPILKSVICVATFIFLVQVSGLLRAAIAPTHDVKIIENPEKAGVPEWKTVWDQARNFSRQNQFARAATTYKKLLRLKPNIEEARWEYSKVLIQLKKWQSATLILESLLEIDPNRTDYLLAAGNVAVNNKQYQQAIKYFGQVYQEKPFAPDAIKALKGLIAGLEGLGKKQEIFPLMQQLHLRTPDNSKVLLSLARLAMDLKQLEAASSYYTTLIANFNVQDNVLLEASRVYEQRGLKDKAVLYLLKYLERHPDDPSIQKRVADYYLRSGKRRLALPHLLVLNRQGRGGDDMLLLIGSIYLHDEKRPDKALFYYENYLKKHPDDLQVQKQIAATQTMLAQNMLSIVLNNGAKMLWHDLAKITPDPQAIYETMAKLLGRMGKEKEQFEVLQIIYSHNPQDKNVIWQLAELSFAKKRYKEAYRYLKLLTGNENEFPSSLSLRGQVEEILGYEYEALSTYRRYLKEEPDRVRVRLKALKLAGDLGLIGQLQSFYRGIPQKFYTGRQREEFEKLYLDGLIRNKIYTDVEDLFPELLKYPDGRNPKTEEIKLRLAENYYREGRIFQAEQMAREVLAQNIITPKALEILTQMAFDRGSLAWGKAWLYVLSKKTGVDLLRKNYTHWPEGVFYKKVELFVTEHQYQRAIAMVTDYRDQLVRTAPSNIDKLLSNADLELCRLYYKSGQYRKAIQHIFSLLEKQPEEPELLVILKTIAKKYIPDARMEKKIHLVTSVKPRRLTYILNTAAYEFKYGQYPEAEKNIGILLQRIPSSVNVRILYGKILIAQKRYDRALKVFHALSEEYPREQYFRRQVWELEFKTGNFKRLAKEIKEFEKSSRAISQAKQGELNNSLYWQRLLLARSLWAAGQFDDSISVYEKLLKNPVRQLFQKEIRSVKLNFPLQSRKKSIWNIVTFSNPENEDLVTTVMEPLFVGRHIGSPIDSISAGLYGGYRWQKLIKNELSAKQAVMRRDYHQAEKEYRALIKKGDSDETLYDLAQVYSRLELYGKEGKLYEQLKKSGTEYPQLKDLVRENLLKTMPRVSLACSFLDANGRNGYIDIRRKGCGVGGWRMPAFNQELTVQAERNDYFSSDSSKNIWTTRLYGTYTINLNDDTDLLLNLGGNFVNSNANFLYKLQLKGRMNEFLSGDIAVSQAMVEDTLEAITERVSHRDIETGLKIDYFPRLFLGGDFRYRQYSDDNNQSWYHLWSSYDLFGPLSHLQLKYEYSAFQNSRSNLGAGPDSEGEFASGDLPYWSPGTYWQHLITVRYKQDVATETGSRPGTSYYTVDYSLGYESGNEMINSVGLNIFLEISRHFLLKGNFIYYDASSYIMNTGMLSLIYRW